MTAPELDFTGSPAIVIPKNALVRWHGMYVPADDALSADVTIDGEGWTIDDTMDFDHPRTAYDRVCAIDDRAIVLTTLGDLSALILHGNGDAWGFVDDVGCIVCNPDPASVAELKSVASGGWDGFDIKETVVWQFDQELLMLNSGSHGAMQASAEEPRLTLALQPGAYEVQFGMVGASDVFRFVRRASFPASVPGNH